MKHISMFIIAVLTLTLLATTQKAGPVKHIQATTETVSSQPSTLETSIYLSAVEFSFLPQGGKTRARREPLGGGMSVLLCKGRKDCGDLKKSGKCKSGTLKANVGSNGRYYGECIAK